MPVGSHSSWLHEYVFICSLVLLYRAIDSFIQTMPDKSRKYIEESLTRRSCDMKKMEQIEVYGSKALFWGYRLRVEWGLYTEPLWRTMHPSFDEEVAREGQKWAKKGSAAKIISARNEKNVHFLKKQVKLTKLEVLIAKL